MAGETILIVDDVEINLKVASAILRNDGYRVETAMDGIQALASLEVSRPDLILCDIQMPRMDGLELTRTIRKDARLRDIPMIAWTAFAMKANEQEALAAGFNTYLTKPTDGSTLRGCVRRLLDSL
jgi:CheY-like chemotaxis protein